MRSKLCKVISVFFVMCFLVVSAFFNVGMVKAEESSPCPAIYPEIIFTKPASFPYLSKGTEGKFEYEIPRAKGYEDIEIKGTARFKYDNNSSNVLKVDEDGNYKAIGEGKAVITWDLIISEETQKEFMEKYGAELGVLEIAILKNVYVVDDKKLKEIDPVITFKEPETFPVFEKGTEGKISSPRIEGYEDVEIKGIVKFSPCDNDIIKIDEDGNYKAISNGSVSPIQYTIELSDETIQKFIDKYGVRFKSSKIYGGGFVSVSDFDKMVYRLYNPNSGEHFYTYSKDEINNLVTAGWKKEGIAWKSPAISNTPVYRLYNPNAGDHHYTVSAEEKDSLVTAGWNYEGIAWYSDDDKGATLYRVYNPNAVAGSHLYTLSEAEKDNLVNAGWKSEGIAWYGKIKYGFTSE